MNKCIRCNVMIADETDRCPLCKQVVKRADPTDISPVGDKFSLYPDVKAASRLLRIFVNITLFLSIAAMSVLFAIDYLSDKTLNWSIIVMLVLLYANVTLRLSIIGKSGYIFKTLAAVVLTFVFLLGIDLLTGDRGWALTYVFPGAIIAMVVATIIIMIVNRRNWQSYMMLQIFLVLLGIVSLILCILGVVEFIYPSLIALAAALFLFLGTFIIGDRRARTELKRRFHI